MKQYEVFKESITFLIQNSNLDVGIIYYILKDIFKDVENAYYQAIQKEIIEEKEEDENQVEA